MNRIQSLFRQKNINNQPKISRRSQRRRNIAVKANCFVLNVLLSNILDFSPFFLAVISRRAKGLEEDKSSLEEPTDAAATTAKATTTTTTSNSSDGESPDEVPSSSASAIEGYVEDGTVASCSGFKHLVCMYPLLSCLDSTRAPKAPVARLLIHKNSRLGCTGPLDTTNGHRGQSIQPQLFQPHSHNSPRMEPMGAIDPPRPSRNTVITRTDPYS